MDVVDRVKALHKQGVKISHIAQQCGISRPTVYSYLRATEQPKIGRPKIDRPKMGGPKTQSPITRKVHVQSYPYTEQLLGLLTAVCEQAHDDHDHEFIAPLQEYAQVYIEGKAEDHIRQWIHSRVKRRK